MADEDEYTVIYIKPKTITPDLPIEEPDNSLSMGDEHLNTILETEKSSVEDLVLIPSEFKGISEDICDVPSCDHFDAKCGLINSLLSLDILITSPKIDFLPEEFAGELDFIDLILPGTDFDEEDFDEEDFDEEEGYIDNDILQIEDEILHEKLLNVNLLVDKIEALNFTPYIPFVLENPSFSPIPVVDREFLIEEVDTFLVSEDSIPPGTDIKEMDKIKAKPDKAKHEKDKVKRARNYQAMNALILRIGQLMYESTLHHMFPGCHSGNTGYIPPDQYRRFEVWDTNKKRMDVKSAFLYGTIKEEVYVSQPLDDIIFGSTKKSLCTDFEHIMHKRFEMSSMGELTFFLGLQVKQKEDGIFISQDKYVGEILKTFGFSSIGTASTPIETNKALTKDEDSEDVDVHLYRSMIGSLMYLTSSRPDIMFSVCACSRFQVQPKVSHLNVIKRIFRYLKGRPKLGLWYPKDSPFLLEVFLDSDYAGASLDRKSTTGGCQFLGSRLISWQCKKQTVVANSTTEAEYIAASHCCGQVLWIQNQMLDYGYNFMQTKIHVDNESAICVVKNPVYHSKTKHIEIRHHFIRDSYEKRLIEMVKIHTNNNVADLLTKAFDVKQSSMVGFGGSPMRQDIMMGAPTQTMSERVFEQPNEPPLSKGHTFRSREGRMERQFELIAIVPITPHDLPLPGGHTPGSNEGRLKLQELMTIVHTLFMDGTPMEINMLVEKKYPLIKELLEKMLNLQLEGEEESTMAFELIKFIKSMLEE
ncbi:putative ribonuclease H-like domain-containing protein [Tanacetum coccineum]